MRISWRVLIDIVAPALCVCWIGYLAYGAILGATGFRELQRVQALAAQKTAELETLTRRRQHLELVAGQLNPKSLDPDMADEKIRSVLGYVAAGDIVVAREQLDKLFKNAKEHAP